MSFFDEIKNTVQFVDDFILECPKCGNEKLEQCRISMRGTGQDDKGGLYCGKCRMLYQLKN